MLALQVTKARQLRCSLVAYGAFFANAPAWNLLLTLQEPKNAEKKNMLKKTERSRRGHWIKTWSPFLQVNRSVAFLLPQMGPELVMDDPTRQAWNMSF